MLTFARELMTGCSWVSCPLLQLPWRKRPRHCRRGWRQFQRGLLINFLAVPASLAQMFGCPGWLTASKGQSSREGMLPGTFVKIKSALLPNTTRTVEWDAVPHFFFPWQYCSMRVDLVEILLPLATDEKAFSDVMLWNKPTCLLKLPPHKLENYMTASFYSLQLGTTQVITTSSRRQGFWFRSKRRWLERTPWFWCSSEMKTLHEGRALGCH